MRLTIRQPLVHVLAALTWNVELQRFVVEAFRRWFLAPVRAVRAELLTEAVAKSTLVPASNPQFSGPRLAGAERNDPAPEAFRKVTCERSPQ